MKIIAALAYLYAISFSFCDLALSRKYVKSFRNKPQFGISARKFNDAPNNRPALPFKLIATISFISDFIIYFWNQYALVPKLLLGNAPWYKAPALSWLLLNFQCVDFHQSRQFQVISGAGIDPILRLLYCPNFYGIMMNILYLLHQHFFGTDNLGMKTFLPDLIVAFFFMSKLMVFKLA